MRLTVEGCRNRQKRLLERMESLGVEVAVLGDPAHVLYFTGYETPLYFSSALVIDRRGKSVLLAPSESESSAADECVVVEPSFLATMHLDHSRRIAEEVKRILGLHDDRLLGIDKGGASAYLGELSEGSVDLSSVLYSLRRRKHVDELVLLKEGIRITERCYARAREIIEPGVNEVEVYTELYRTACLSAGEKLPAMGNDFQCASPGGPPRDRKAAEGELYILDLGVVIGGYNADNSRTFSVDRNPTAEQLSAWKRIADLLDFIEENVRPGSSCRKLYEEAKVSLDKEIPDSFFHHLGHGVGLAPHERPNLNPHWDHTFEEGDFFTAEPGLYSEELKAGIRLEENYLVTASGVDKLTSFPLEL